MSLYYSVYDDDPDKPPLLTEIPDIWQLQRNMQRYLRQKQNPNYKDSGSVMPLHVHSVLAIDGNIREQCYQILTLMARERKCRVLKFIFFTTNERLPNCFNDSVLSEYRRESFCCMRMPEIGPNPGTEATLGIVPTVRQQIGDESCDTGHLAKCPVSQIATP